MNSQFLIKLYNELDKKAVKFNLPCEKGCSECCDSPPYITFLEWQLIKKFLKGRKINKLNEDTCPLLINCACSIYPVRPVVCRLYGWSYCTSNRTHIIYPLACDKVNVRDIQKLISFDRYWKRLVDLSSLNKGEPKPINEFLKTA